VNIKEPQRASPVEWQGRNRDLEDIDNAPVPASSLPQVEDLKNQPRSSVTSTAQEEIQVKLKVAKRIAREEALILENGQELEKIKKKRRSTSKI